MLAAVGPDLHAGAVVLLHDGLGPGALRQGCEETVRFTRMIGGRGGGGVSAATVAAPCSARWPRSPRAPPRATASPPSRPTP